MRCSNDSCNKQISKDGGLKYSADKPRTELFPFQAFLNVDTIITYGAKKYTPNNWRKNPINVYFGAALRHLLAWALGEEYDKESGLPHIDHAACNLMFASELFTNGKRLKLLGDEIE